MERKTTLPSSTLNPLTFERQAGDPGGQKYPTLRPTLEQQRTAGEREGRRRTVELFKRRGDPRSETLAAVMESGQDINAALLNDPDADHRRRLTEIEAGGRQQRLTQGVAEAARRRAAEHPTVTPRDRVQAIRQADAAAADYISSLGGDYGILPEGVNADEIRQQFVDEYMAALEPGPSGRTPGQTRRIVAGLSRIMPAPTRTGGTSNRLMVDVVPRGARPLGGVQPGSSDPYEQYLARTGGR